MEWRSAAPGLTISIADDNHERHGLFFDELPERYVWGYACPPRDGESPGDAFNRVVAHISAALPGFARPDQLTAYVADGRSLADHQLPVDTGAWQEAILGCVRDNDVLELSLVLAHVLRTADEDETEWLIDGNITVDDSRLTEHGEQGAVAVTFSLGHDLYAPPPADADPRHHKQADHNRPRLARFLASLQDDLDARFVFRNHRSIGPEGIVD